MLRHISASSTAPPCRSQLKHGEICSETLLRGRLWICCRLWRCGCTGAYSAKVRPALPAHIPCEQADAACRTYAASSERMGREVQCTASERKPSPVCFGWCNTLPDDRCHWQLWCMQVLARPSTCVAKPKNRSRTSQRTLPELCVQASRQETCMSSILPLHLHGWMRGSLRPSGPPQHIRQSFSTSGSTLARGAGGASVDRCGSIGCDDTAMLVHG